MYVYIKQNSNYIILNTSRKTMRMRQRDKNVRSFKFVSYRELSTHSNQSILTMKPIIYNHLPKL